MAKKALKPAALVKNLLLFLGSLLLFLLVAEGLTRLVDPSLPFQGDDDAVWSIHRRSPDPVLVYEPRPGAHSSRPRVWDEEQSVTYSINGLGLRDREDLTIEKPPGVSRVLFLGDSVTFGLEVDLEETYVKQVERLLPQGWPVECLNLGVSGYSPLQEMTLLETRGLAFDPDLVVFCYNLNDPIDFSGELGYFFRQEAQGRLFRFGGYRTGYWLGRSRFLGWLAYRVEKLLALQESKNHLEAVVMGARRERVEELLAENGLSSGESTPPPESASGLAAGETWNWVVAAHRNPQSWATVRAAFTRMGRLSLSEDIPVLLAILPVFVDEQPYPFADVHRFVAAEARRTGLPVVDLQPLLGVIPLSTLSFDNLHPTTEGHRALAEALVPEVARKLQK